MARPSFDVFWRCCGCGVKSFAPLVPKNRRPCPDCKGTMWERLQGASPGRVLRTLDWARTTKVVPPADRLQLGERLVWTGEGGPVYGKVVKLPPLHVPNNGVATVEEDDGTLTNYWGEFEGCWRAAGWRADAFDGCYRGVSYEREAYAAQAACEAQGGGSAP